MESNELLTAPGGITAPKAARGFAPTVFNDPAILYALKIVAIDRLGVLDLADGEPTAEYTLTNAQLRSALSSAFLCGMNHATALGLIEAAQKTSALNSQRRGLDPSARADMRAKHQGSAF